MTERGGGEGPEAIYANYLEVGFTAHEFLLRFGQGYADEQPASVHSRIVTTPAYARAFLQVLSKSLEEYDSEHAGGNVVGSGGR
jgi:hypothetical protein